MRIKYHFKKYLEKSNSLIDVYQDEINQLEILNSSLIKIKDLYKSAIIKVLYHEQERRNQIRQDKIRKNDRDENDLKISIEQDEEREKQLLEALNKKQEEIFKIEQDLNRIIDE
ncbi:unnamed protein product, partial [Rotaria magnacalcarata]